MAAATTFHLLRKPHLIYRYASSDNLEINGYTEGTEKDYLLKYFPKYYKRLSVDATRSNPLRTKIKRIKKLNEFNGVFRSRQSKLLWLVLLANNRKSIHKIPNTVYVRKYQEEFETYEFNLTLIKLKFFYKIQFLDLPYTIESLFINPYRIGQYSLNQFNLHRIIQLMGHIRTLKMLRIVLKGPIFNEMCEVLSRIDKMKRFLSSLQSLELNIQVYRHNNYDSSIILENHEVIKSLTSLCFYSDSVPLENNKLGDFLVSLSGLNNLIFLEIFWEEDPQTFLKNFRLPSKLKHCKIFFSKFQWQEIFANQKEIDWSRIVSSQDPNPFEINPSFQLFYQQWTNSAQLISLEFMFSTFPSGQFISKYFITPILKNTQRLTCFRSFIGANRTHDDTSFQSIFNAEFRSHLPFLVEEIPHLFSSLRELVINSGSSGKELMITTEELSNFTNLQSLSLFESFSSKGFPLQKVVNLIKINSFHPEEYSLKIHDIKIESAAGLEALFDTIRHLQKPKKLIVDFGIKVHADTEDIAFEVLEAFCHFMKSIKRIEGLDFQICFSQPNHYKLDSERLKTYVCQSPQIGPFTILEDWNNGFAYYIFKYGKIVKEFFLGY